MCGIRIFANPRVQENAPDPFVRTRLKDLVRVSCQWNDPNPRASLSSFFFSPRILDSRFARWTFCKRKEGEKGGGGGWGAGKVDVSRLFFYSPCLRFRCNSRTSVIRSQSWSVYFWWNRPSRITRRLIFLLLFFPLFFHFSPPVFFASVDRRRRHLEKPGDSLSRLKSRPESSASRSIIDSSNFSDPSLPHSRSIRSTGCSRISRSLSLRLSINTFSPAEAIFVWFFYLG